MSKEQEDILNRWDELHKDLLDLPAKEIEIIEEYIGDWRNREATERLLDKLNGESDE